MTEQVTAARFELTMDRTGTPLGRLVYGKSYLARGDAVPFDPVELRLGPRVYETTILKGIFKLARLGGRRIPVSLASFTARSMTSSCSQ